RVRAPGTDRARLRRNRRAEGEDPRPHSMVALRRVLRPQRAPGPRHRPRLASVGSTLALLLPVAAAVIGVGAWLGRLVARRQAEAWAAGVRGVVEAIRAAAAAERAEALKAAEVAGRDEARAAGAAFESFCAVREAELEAAGARVARREAELEAELA